MNAVKLERKRKLNVPPDTEMDFQSFRRGKLIFPRENLAVLVLVRGGQERMVIVDSEYKLTKLRQKTRKEGAKIIGHFATW